MSFAINKQSINISRSVLIEKLKEGLLDHQSEYKEALTDYKLAVVKFMKEAYERAVEGDFKNLTPTFNQPVNHESDYKNVIELMEYSVDENINLDADAFRAYIKGEWFWKSQFTLSSSLIKSYIGS